MPVAIAGMHRAGTSMVARVLRICGLDVGGEEHFAPPAPDNTEGYWEDLRFVSVDERLLEAFGGAWDAPPAFPAGWTADPRLAALRAEAEALGRSRVEPWGWKDPRTSLAAPFWREVLPGLRFVVCVRNPLEVAGSLRARGFTSQRFGLRLWEAYHQALEDAVPAGEALVTHYDSYFLDAPAEIDRLLAFVGLRPSPEMRQAAADSALAGARHQRRGRRELADALPPSAARLYASLCARSGPVFARAEAPADDAAPSAPAPARVQSIAERDAELIEVLAAREEELASVKPVLAARERELAAFGELVRSRDQETAALRGIVAARDEEVASLKAVLAARDEELAAVKPVLAARETELSSLKGKLAAHEHELARPLWQRLLRPGKPRGG